MSGKCRYGIAHYAMTASFHTISNSLLIILPFDAVPPKLDIDIGSKQTTDKKGFGSKVNTYCSLAHWNFNSIYLRILVLLLRFI